MIKFRKEQIIDVTEWDDLVIKTYARPYSFQQQDGCKERQNFRIEVPCSEVYDYENDSVPEEVNHSEMGVSFKAWLSRDPKQQIPGRDEAWALELWWHRNFYPDVSMIINDLHAKGLLPAGSYLIDIDW